MLVWWCLCGGSDHAAAWRVPGLWSLAFEDVLGRVCLSGIGLVLLFFTAGIPLCRVYGYFVVVPGVCLPWTATCGFTTGAFEGRGYLPLSALGAECCERFTFLIIIASLYRSFLHSPKKKITFSHNHEIRIS
ncbi:hypothetical protein AMECASPLE_018360 [Ameca splendens]|uniref:Uncharacterized protein n=1 Tax=Ameca splendens TaxID=208324 RepID=A0ABV0Z1Y4_9TELE